MWAQPDGRRVLLAPDHRTADFVTAVYGFDDVRVVPFEEPSGREPNELHVVAGPVALRFVGGRPWLLLPPRPRWFTRRVEAPIAAADYVDVQSVEALQPDKDDDLPGAM